MNKLTKKEIEEIIFMKNKEIPTKEIANKFNVTIGTVFYHVKPEYRILSKERRRKWYQNLSKEKKRELLDRGREYQRIYHLNKYKTDEKFRSNQQMRMRKK